MAQAIVPRDLDVDFSKVPKYWLANSPVATAISNGVNMLFPHGERFFVRSVKHFFDQIEDPELRQQIKGFFGQEGRHAHAHDEFNDILRQQDPIIKRVFLRGIREYLRRDFHPSQNDDSQLAATWFAAHGMALPEAA